MQDRPDRNQHCQIRHQLVVRYRVEIAFQILRGTNVRFNEFFRKPLLQTFEEVERLFTARVFDEKEFQAALNIVSLPLILYSL